MKWAALATSTSTVTAAALLTLGLWRSDCVLVASAALAAQRSFQVSVERHRPDRLLHLAARYFTAGSLGMLASTLLLAMILGAWFGWWQTAHDADFATVEVLSIAAAVLVAARRHWFGSLTEAALWSIVVIGATVAWQSANVLSIGASCVFALVTAVVVGAWAWRQLCTVGPAYLRQAIEP